MQRKRSIWVGWDSREADAYDVAVYSIKRRLSSNRPLHPMVNPIILEDLQRRNLYTRPTAIAVEGRVKKMRDTLSATDSYDGSMATEFAVSRFLAKHLAKYGLALFCDCDVLPRCDFEEIFSICEADPSKALWCVKHKSEPMQRDEAAKMDGQLQTFYRRKNWSSLYVIDCDHVANQALTLKQINTLPGRDLHAFSWLPDDLIGELPATYNHLVGIDSHDPDAKVVHFTKGGPWLDAYRHVPFADEWRREWADAKGVARPKEAAT